MTYALILVKGKTEKRIPTLKFLDKISKGNDFKEETGTSIERILLSFGWPDFILMLKSENIEQLRNAIGTLRNELASHGDYVETSTIICSSLSEMREKKREWAEI